MKRLALALMLFATPAAADPLYKQFEASSESARYEWASGFVKKAMPELSIGARQRVSFFIVGCAKEYQPGAPIEFAQFVAVCAALAEAEEGK